MGEPIAVLLTCHDRREKTLTCLRSLHDELDGRFAFEVFLTDDGSTDRTAQAVVAEFPKVHVVAADGSLFWCRGMERAWRAALEAGSFDAYLWVNDDVEFFPGALTGLLERVEDRLGQAGEPAIVVGSLVDPDTGRLTYGGSVLTSGWHPGRMRKVEPDDHDFVPIDTLNGNVVLVPQAVVDRIGILDPVFSHATGDNDYGFRATAAGVPVLLAPGTVGTCRRNPPAAPSLRALLGRKGLPIRDWFVYTRRHGGRLRWPVAFMAPYLRGSIQVAFRFLRGAEKVSPEDRPLHVAHLLGPLHRSGAEVMLVNASELFHSSGIEGTIVSLHSVDDSSNADALERAGYEVVHLGGTSRRALRAYWHLLRDGRPDCVHVHAEQRSVITTTLPRLLRIPVVRTVHNSFGFDGFLRARKTVERAWSRSLGVRFVTVSPSVEANERTRFRNRSIYIDNWFDDRVFAAPTVSERERSRAHLQVESDTPVVAVVGNCSHVKNHTLVFEALAASPATRRPVVVHVGRDDQSHSERELVDRLGVSEWVRFLGVSDDVVGILHGSDAYAMPSLYEGMSVAAIEAATTGLPLLVADSPGLRDLSLLLPETVLLPLDQKAWAEALAGVELLPAHDARRARQVKEARVRFSRSKGAAAYAALYRGRRPVGTDA